jgi:hypothetical protein
MLGWRLDRRKRERAWRRRLGHSEVGSRDREPGSRRAPVSTAPSAATSEAESVASYVGCYTDASRRALPYELASSNAAESKHGEHGREILAGGAHASSVIPYETSATTKLEVQTAVSVSGGAFGGSLEAESVTTFVGTAE